VHVWHHDTEWVSQYTWVSHHDTDGVSQYTWVSHHDTDGVSQYTWVSPALSYAVWYRFIIMWSKFPYLVSWYWLGVTIYLSINSTAPHYRMWVLVYSRHDSCDPNFHPRASYSSLPVPYIDFTSCHVTWLPKELRAYRWLNSPKSRSYSLLCLLTLHAEWLAIIVGPSVVHYSGTVGILVLVPSGLQAKPVCSLAMTQFSVGHSSWRPVRCSEKHMHGQCSSWKGRLSRHLSWTSQLIWQSQWGKYILPACNLFMAIFWQLNSEQSLRWLNIVWH